MAGFQRASVFSLLVLVAIFANQQLTEAADPEFSYPEVFNDPERDMIMAGKFPKDFAWGSATSAYQIEGGWDADGKGESIWDTFSQGCRCYACQTGNMACDSYNKIADDVAVLKELGVSHYRFSLSWPRIMPTGEGDVNEAGLQYYDDLIDALLEAGIEPVVTLYHWDLPQHLQDAYGGWQNDTVAGLFNTYADICFARYADRVSIWITFNEPYVVCWLGYGINVFAPGIYDPGYGAYRAAHTIIKSHAMAYNTYQAKYKAQYGGLVSITLSTDYGMPDNPDNPDDVEAAIRYMQFTAGWFAHPILKNGDYPDMMKWKVGNKSLAQGLSESRLPTFTAEEKAMIKGTGDFFGLNAYTSTVVKDKPNANSDQNYEADQDVERYQPDEWPTSGSGWLRPVPWGMRGLLNWLKDEYNVPVYITENGFSDPDIPELNDEGRVTYYRAYINEVLKAIKLDGVDVKGYFAWSLMDNFEWTSGYSQRFGMHYVDFNDEDRTRTRKESANFYTELIENNGFSSAERDALISGKFPDDFIWGSATSAYQIEGGWDADGKGESIWDKFAHDCRCHECQNGDVACDSYNKYENDVQVLKDLGVSHYRFSLSWPRIMPTGEGEVNEAGLQYYDNLIDALLEADIVPVITLYHWDLPQYLQEQYGGWENDALAGLFNTYADTCYARYSDRVNFWITFNEPYVVCWLGYGINVFAPGIYDPGYAPYRAAHTIIKAHAMAYNTYQDKYKAQYGGMVSITLSTDYGMPDNPDNPDDVEAAIRYMQFTAGWFAHPIMKTGDYPDAMKWKVGNKSIAQGLNESRLPSFTEEEKAMIKGTGDFFGLNAYTTTVVKDKPNSNSEPHYEEDQDVERYQPDEWPTSGSEWLRPAPFGMRDLLNWVKDEYNLPVYVTENGVSTPPDMPDKLKDESRIIYYRAYINEVLKAINDGVDVRGYFAWSFLDNFEWAAGYSQRFGLHDVDFEDDNRPRTRKDSADFYTELIEYNGFSGASKHIISLALVILMATICLKAFYTE
ncbi:lactase/phlorizin hydrolase-like [Amphiura filiformis]|uniref:lactase/phlorizin hydrolase-like n=1 Tax=Amphiura filiformis TaxID=82378 RepID=UPI003B2223B9